MNFEPEIASLIPELEKTRKDLHQHPELGFEEERTSLVVAERLEALGFQVIRGVAETGVVALWRGRGEAGTLAFRADMDALPLQEENDHTFVSRNPGVMHACGHDGHVAILLGFARWLAERPDPFPGHIKLIFQPGEEGHGGAKRMIKEGVLDDPKVDRIVGLHLWNFEKIGTAHLKAGTMMAGTDEFSIKVLGKGGHAAIPQDAVDPVLVSAHIITALQAVVSRRIDPIDAAVVSVCRISAGTAHNIIPDTASMYGTVRTLDPDLRARMPHLIEETAAHTARAFGAETKLQWETLYPPTLCHEETVRWVRKALIRVMGEEAVRTPKPTMGAEDMSYYLEEVPGCYFFLGSANPEKGLDAPHHHPCFDFDEDVLPLGVACFAEIAKAFFSNP